MINKILITGMAYEYSAFPKMLKSLDSKILIVETSAPTNEGNQIINETMVDKNTSYDNYSDCMDIYENFLRRWHEGALSNDDEVIKIVKNLSTKILKYYPKCDTEDLVHETLIKLYSCNYRGGDSLEGYIRMIMKNWIIANFGRENLSRRCEMPDEIGYKEKFPEQLEMAEQIKKLLARTPKHLWWFIKTVLSNDYYLSERKIAQIGKISRYKVTKLKEELRQIWENLNHDSVNCEMKAKSAFVFDSCHSGSVVENKGKGTLEINALKSLSTLAETKNRKNIFDLYDCNEGTNKDITGFRQRKWRKENNFVAHVNKKESTCSKNFDKALNDSSFKAPELDQRSHLGINFELERKSTSRCVDGEAFWWDDLDFDASDNEIVKFYEHAEVCQYHREMIEKSDKEFINHLTSLQSAFENEDEIWLENNTDLKQAFTKSRLLSNRGRSGFIKQNNLFIINSISGEVIALMNNNIYTLTCKISSEIGKKAVVLLLIDLHSIIKNYGGNLIKQLFIEDEEATITLILDVSANLEEINNICEKFKLYEEITSVNVGCVSRGGY